MKTFKFLFLIAIFIGLLTGCNKDELTFSDDVQLKSAQVEVTEPFEVNLLGEIVVIDFEAQECIDDGYAVRAIVETTGNATQMGKVSLTFNFCSGGAPDPDVEGSVYTYAGSNADLIAANGDVLHLAFNDGIVIGGRTEEHPENVVEYWRTPLTVVGGTGRFEGAKGELKSNDYVTSDQYTHHHFYGEITLIKGK